MQQRFSRFQTYAPALGCALLFAAVILASRPFAEIGIEDDWSYVRSAQVLAETGHIVYNGWATAMLGPQLYLGALAFKLFGFSFTAARATVLLTGMATTVLLQHVLLRFGLNRFNSIATTLLIMLAPIMQPLSFTFHTDVPGLLCIVATLYCCQRAIAAQSSRSVVLWLALGSVCGVTGGSIRQIAWLSALVMVPSAAWLRRRGRGVVIAAAVLWVASFASVVGILHWFNAQPYSVPEHLKTDAWRTVPGHLAIYGTGMLLDFPLLILPFLIAVALRFPFRQRPFAAAAFATVSVALPAITMGRQQLGVPWLEPYAINILSARGLVDMIPLLSDKPVILGPHVRFLLTFVCLFAALLACAQVRRALDDKGRSLLLKKSWMECAILLGPFTLSYALLLLPRCAFGLPVDRYMIPLTVVAGAFLAKLYQECWAAHLPPLCLATGVVLATAGFVGMHDLFAFERARVAAIDELRAGGVPRQHIGGGFEYDDWTQVTTSGTLAEGRVEVPKKLAYYLPAWRTGTCHTTSEFLLPDVHPDYYLSTNRSLCARESSFAPVPVSLWTYRKPIEIYILLADQPYDWVRKRPRSLSGN